MHAARCDSPTPEIVALGAAAPDQLHHNPIVANCGDGATLNQACYLAPNSGPGNFGSIDEISPNGLRAPVSSHVIPAPAGIHFPSARNPTRQCR
jgi:hypothetical protein